MPLYDGKNIQIKTCMLFGFAIIIIFFTFNTSFSQSRWGANSHQLYILSNRPTDIIIFDKKLFELFGVKELYYFKSEFMGASLFNAEQSSSCHIISGIKAIYIDNNSNQWLLVLKSTDSMTLTRVLDQKYIEFWDLEFAKSLCKKIEKEIKTENPTAKIMFDERNFMSLINEMEKETDISKKKKEDTNKSKIKEEEVLKILGVEKREWERINENSDDLIDVLLGTREKDYLNGSEKNDLSDTNTDQENPKPYSAGFYFDVSFLQNTISGDFSGKTVAAKNDSIFLPKVPKSYAYNITLGFRDFCSALEISYQNAIHNISYFDSDTTIGYGMVSINIKRYFFYETPIQPYIIVGIGFPWISTEDKSFPDFGHGIGANLGGGLTLFFSHNVSINGGFMYRPIAYKKVKPTGKDEFVHFDKRVKGSSFTYFFGITFGF